MIRPTLSSRGGLVRLLVGALFTATLAGTAACGAGGGEPTTAAGNAPDFSLQSVDGKTVRLSDYAGKSVVLLDFWSTTCDPCMVEMPHLVDLYKANKDKGFVVLAISLDGPESLAEVNRVVHDKDMVFPVLLDQETVVVSRYNPKKEMPFSVLIGKNGDVIEKHAGYQPGDEKALATKVATALAAK